MEHTKFVMIQGLIGAFCVRIPVSFLMSRWEPVTLFHIGLGIPCATMVQIATSTCYLIYLRKHMDIKSPQNN